jgi:transposase
MTQLPSPRIFRKGGKNYRRWTDTHKRQIVEETFVPGSSVSIVARRHDVNANQVFKWRQLYHRGELGGIPVKAVDGFLPVGVIGHNGVLTAAAAIAEKQESANPMAITSGAAVTALPVQTARSEPVTAHYNRFPIMAIFAQRTGKVK